MPIALFDPADDPHGHAAIVFRQFADGISVPPDEGTRILRRIFAAGARCAVWAHPQQSWVVLGFAIVAPRPQTVVWCWTRPNLRGRPKDGKPAQHVMSTLLQKLDIDLKAPLIACYRSPAAEGMRGKGKFQITFADEMGGTA